MFYHSTPYSRYSSMYGLLGIQRNDSLFPLMCVELKVLMAERCLQHYLADVVERRESFQWACEVIVEHWLAR